LLKIELAQSNDYEFAISNCVEIMHDGKCIISGWTDGIIRAFLP
jgi:hypothetical protein